MSKKSGNDSTKAQDQVVKSSYTLRQGFKIELIIFPEKVDNIVWMLISIQCYLPFEEPPHPSPPKNFHKCVSAKFIAYSSPTPAKESCLFQYARMENGEELSYL